MRINKKRRKERRQKDEATLKQFKTTDKTGEIKREMRRNETR